MQRGFWGSGPIQLSLISLVFLLFFRMEYLFWNWKEFALVDTPTLLQAFLIGWRFDLAATAWLTAPFWLLYFVLPLAWARNALKLTILFLLWVFPFVFINSVDIILMGFTGKRMTAGSLYLLNEAEGRTAGIVGPYFAPMAFQILIFLSVYFLIFVYAKRRPIFSYPLRMGKHLVISFVALALVVIVGRGGLQKKPLTFSQAHVFSETSLNNLALNSTFTVLKTWGKTSVQKLHFFENKEQYQSFLNWQPTQPRADWAQNIKFEQKPNIVLIVVESLALEYMSVSGNDKSYTPFLNSLADKSVFFTNAFANSRRSIEGIGALFAGVPALMDEPFISSEFVTNSYEGLGTLLKREGYVTSFFHGAENGTMYFDSFMKSAGVDRYEGLNEYPGGKGKDFDGTWGIYDRPYLNYFASQLQQMPSPFFSSIFTLTSHQPYSLPADEQTRFAKGPIENLQTIQYVDEALSNFFAKVQGEEWAQNTIFVITGDHTSLSYKSEYQNEPGKYRVPIIMYSPRAGWPHVRVDDIAQHIDVMPTLLDIVTGQPAPGVKLSQSMLRPHKNKFFMSYFEGQYQIVDHDFFAAGSELGELKVFSRASQNEITDPEKVSFMNQRAKAALQYFSDGLWSHQLY